MPRRRHLIVCEGESEWAYLQRLQSFLEQQQLVEGAFEPPGGFIAQKRAIAGGGSFKPLQKCYKTTRQYNRTASIQIWTDFDLYHRNDHRCADLYKEKPEGIPDFLFSFHNFEDFFALHWDGDHLSQWIQFGSQGHFANPLHSAGYLPEIQKIFPSYRKGTLPVGFITWESLKNLKRNRSYQPSSNPQNLKGIRDFANFLIDEIDLAYPNALAP